MGILRQGKELGSLIGMAVLLVLAAFLVPLLCFGGRSEEWRYEAPVKGDSAGAETKPAVLAPRGPTAGEVQQPSDEKERPSVDSSCFVRVMNEDGTVEKVAMSDYLWGVVAAEMPASFEEEALKAQAVAARTYTLWKMEHNSTHPDADLCKSHTCCQAWRDRTEAMKDWGAESEKFAQKISAAVAETDGMALFWEGHPIQAVYHSSSDGRTEDAVAVWGTAVPYLVGVDTPEGDEVPNHHTAVMLTADEVKKRLEGYRCDLSGNPQTWFGVTRCTANGNVRSIQVGGVSIDGVELRSLFGLRSANFTVSYEEELFAFRTAGYGHGVGMSQYGANAMATAGKTWKEIVTWYYTGVSVESNQKES